MTREPGAGLRDEANGSGWVQKAIANCYLHTPLPSLVRPMRERYCLSRSSGRSWPKLERRMGPTARILYYHRVNDDQDPFFPAISTELFEREMQHVARHYKVVSLDRLLEHLDGRGTETLMTITFDDGYQDNFSHAFPILRRYGLPATIFLTTGCIDGRDPLWFEQLSLALKKTAREQFDLGIDPPQTFRIRTEAERLECNGRIQSFLREVTDSERRQWLARILRVLGVEGNRERHDKMLTWDQIRDMQSQGIDFGGHTITHPFLSKTTEEESGLEISGCKTRIEAELQRPVRYFAYPNGHEEDVSQSNREVVRRAGYRAAVTTTWGINDSRTDRMELRRGGPWEASPAMFAYKLDWYQLTND
jgi:peptidoglycan/xylan/chitin deacetylase (PgdA/CDA1 family)